MGSIIIAMPHIPDAHKISDILKSGDLDNACICLSASEVLKEAGHLESGIVICTGKLKDMNYLELYEYLPDSFEMLLISSKIDDAPPEIAQLPSSFHASDLHRIVSMILAQQARRYKKTVVKPKMSEEDRLVLERAKKILMEKRKLTEPEAHRYLQKNSMDSGCDMVTTAEKIIALLAGDFK